jgi:hypothetical protein
MKYLYGYDDIYTMFYDVMSIPVFQGGPSSGRVVIWEAN